MRTAACLVICLLPLPLAWAQQKSPEKYEGNAAQSATGAELDRIIYRIGIKDRIRISVWAAPELSRTVVVRRDGIITLPLLKDLRVIGLTVAELQALLIKKLTTNRKRTITVVVLEIHNVRKLAPKPKPELQWDTPIRPPFCVPRAVHRSRTSA